MVDPAGRRSCAAVALIVSSTMLSLGSASATTLFPYQNVGAYNAVTYSFKAQNTGDLEAYFTGASAAYDNVVGVLINGVASPVFGLDDHASHIGQSLNFGQVKAGDTLVFVLKILTLGGKSIYSDPNRNAGFDGVSGANHIYATAYDGHDPRLAGVPAGTSVSFEDQAFGHSDYDYNDETFVFTDVAGASTPAPIPGSAQPPGAAPEGPPAGSVFTVLATPPISSIPGDPSPADGPPPPFPTPGVLEPGTWALMLLGMGGVGAVIRRRPSPGPAHGAGGRPLA